MILKSVIAAMAFSLAGFFGCSKTAAPTNPASNASAPTKIKDLGVLQLTNHCETSIAIDANNSCRIVPEMLGRKNLQLTLTLESKNADGKTTGLSVAQVVGEPEKPFEVSISGVDFTFTPKIVEQ